MKTREEIINDMCMTYRHDYRLEISEYDKIEMPFMNGMTAAERKALFDTMAQIFDNDIAPLIDSAMKYEAGTHIPIPANVEYAKGMILVAENYLKHNS